MRQRLLEGEGPGESRASSHLMRQRLLEGEGLG